MPKHDIYRGPDGRGYLLDVQTDWIEGLDTRIVVPLLPVEDAPQVARILNPVVEIEGRAHMMAAQYASAIQGRLLRSPVADLRSRADEVTRALDLLLQGF
jgi:toxin CcdB